MGRKLSLPLSDSSYLASFPGCSMGTRLHHTLHWGGGGGMLHKRCIRMYTVTVPIYMYCVLWSLYVSLSARVHNNIIVMNSCCQSSISGEDSANDHLIATILCFPSVVRATIFNCARQAPDVIHDNYNGPDSTTASVSVVGFR